MTKCIYRKVLLNSCQPADADCATIEHIIPWALGGTNDLTTRDVSKGANNDLGSEVDAAFASTIPIAIMRHRLQIRSQNGNISPIVWRGKSPEGVSGKLTIESNGTVDVDLDTKVEDVTVGGQITHRTVSGARERLEPMLQGILKGMQKRKQVAYSQDGKLLQSVDDFLSVSDSTLIDKFHFEVEMFNHEAWTRGILKIALAFCHKVLGSEWTFGYAAESIRTYVMEEKENWPVCQCRGFIAGEWDRNIRLALGKTANVRDGLHHTLGILPYAKDGEAVVCVSLFGGNGVPESVVNIGKLPRKHIEALNKQGNQDVLLGFRVNPATRAAKEILFGEIDKRIASMGPSNKKVMAVYRDRTLR